MPPEQLEGLPVDHRADIFSFGVLIYELATGRRPFEGGSSIALASSILRDTPPPITDIKKDLPRHFGRIIETCLEKDPERRYQSAKELRNALQSLQRETESAISSDLQSGSRGLELPEDRARSRRRLALGALAGLALIAMVVDFFVTRTRGSEGSGGSVDVARPPLSSEAQTLVEQSRTYNRDGAALPRLKLAEQTLRRALGLEPDSPFLMAEMAYLLASMQEEYPEKERMDEAVRLADAALASDPDLVAAWLAKGELSMLEGDGEAAARAALQAKTIDPEDVRGHVLHGRALLKQGLQSEGLDQLRMAVEMDGVRSPPATPWPRPCCAWVSSTNRRSSSRKCSSSRPDTSRR